MFKKGHRFMGGGRPRVPVEVQKAKKREYQRTYMKSYRIKKKMFGIEANEPVHKKTRPCFGIGILGRISRNKKTQVGEVDGQPVYRNIPGKYKDPWQILEEKRTKEENSGH